MKQTQKRSGFFTLNGMAAIPFCAVGQAALNEAIEAGTIVFQINVMKALFHSKRFTS